ncbi:hypothetical protein [Fusobacterium varium]|uniref:hypothetical protein n=1 Tax=Fusobacterium varium TaxID=856 RepID=UPI0030CC885D
MEKRRGYASTEQQVEANKRYLEANPDAKERKKILSMKSAGKNFIKNYSSLEDLEMFKSLIEEREKILKGD